MLIVPEMPGHKSRAERKDKNYESKEKYYFDGSIIMPGLCRMCKGTARGRNRDEKRNRVRGYGTGRKYCPQTGISRKV